MLFTNNIAILSDVERKLDIHIFIDHGTAIAFYGETVLNQFIEVSSDCLLGNLVNLTQFAYYDSSVVLQFSNISFLLSIASI